MFTPRPIGVTLRRVERYERQPHDGAERFDDHFPVAMLCEHCQKLAFGPRKLMQEAMRVHKESECPARHKTAGDPHMTRLLYPKDGKE